MPDKAILDSLLVVGRELDRTEDAADALLRDVFPDTSTTLLNNFEDFYGLTHDGPIQTRRNRILTAIKKTGGLSKIYYERLGNTLGGSVGPFRYKFDSDLAAPPETKTIRLNTSDPLFATEMYVDKTDTDNEQHSNQILLQPIGNRMFFFDQIDGSSFHEYSITGLPTDDGTYITIPISNVSSTSPVFVDDSKVCIVMGALTGYQVKITDTEGYTGFIIHEFGPDTIPVGPATPLPGQLIDLGGIGDPFSFVVHVYKSPGLFELELEQLIQELKPPWAQQSFVYVA